MPFAILPLCRGIIFPLICMIIPNRGRSSGGEDGKKTKIGYPSYCPLKKAEDPFRGIYL
jgi:hypothetical protein